MKTRHPFQFNASSRTPAVLQRTMLEVFELCNTRFRPFYANAVNAVLDEVRQRGCTHVAELGAGNAPMTRRLLNDPRANGLRFTVCDYLPKPELYRRLQSEHSQRVTGIEEPVDFTQPREWEPGTLLVLSATFHHVQNDLRATALQSLANSADGVMFFAPIRKTLGNVIAGLASPLPALLLPYVSLHRPGRLRRSLWCTLLPVVPLMMLWDGVGGCLRQWSRDDWQHAAASVELPRPLQIQETANSQTVVC